MNFNRVTCRTFAYLGIFSCAWVCAAQGQAETKPKPKAKAAASKPKPAQAESSKLSDKPASSSATIQVISAGKKPLQELRYHPEVGKEQRLKMVMKMAMASSMGPGQEMKADVPEITMTTAVKITEKDDKGNFTQEMTIVDAQVAPAEGQAQMMAESMKATFATMIGKTITSKLDPTGKVIEMAKVDLGPNAAQLGMDVEEISRNVSIGLPKEAVGVGAKWKTVQSLKQAMMDVEIETVSELVEMNGDVLNIKTTINGSAPRQNLSLPNAPPTAKAELIEMLMSGGGTAKVSLGFTGALSGENKMETKGKMKFTQGDQVMEMSQNITMNMTISEDSAPAK